MVSYKCLWGQDTAILFFYGKHSLSLNRKVVMYALPLQTRSESLGITINVLQLSSKGPFSLPVSANALCAISLFMGSVTVKCSIPAIVLRLYWISIRVYEASPIVHSWENFFKSRLDPAQVAQLYAITVLLSFYVSLYLFLKLVLRVTRSSLPAQRESSYRCTWWSLELPVFTGLSILPDETPLL